MPTVTDVIDALDGESKGWKRGRPPETDRPADLDTWGTAHHLPLLDSGTESGCSFLGTSRNSNWRIREGFATGNPCRNRAAADVHPSSRPVRTRLSDPD